MKIRLISFGVKSVVAAGSQTPLPKADLYFDCRVIRNPYHAPGMASLGGDHPKLQEWCLAENADVLDKFLSLINVGLTTIPDRRRDVKEGAFSVPVTLAFFCAYGVHRSVAMKHLVAKKLLEQGLNVEVL